MVFFTGVGSQDPLQGNQQWTCAFDKLLCSDESWDKVLLADNKHTQESFDKHFDKLVASNLRYLDEEDVLSEASWRKLWQVIPGMMVMVSGAETQLTGVKHLSGTSATFAILVIQVGVMSLLLGTLALHRQTHIALLCTVVSNSGLARLGS